MENQSLSGNNFHRLVEYIVYIVPYFLQRYIKNEILKTQSLHKVLTVKKHFVFHLFVIRKCCQCKTNTQLPKKPTLIKDQFTVLYDIEGIQTQNCKKGNNYPCPCVITVNSKVTMKSLDIKLVSCIFKHALPVAPEEIEKIIHIRNEVFHRSDAHDVSNEDFEQYWKSLSKSLGNIVGPKYKDELQKEEQRVLSQVLSSSPILQEMQLRSDVSKDRIETLKLQLTILAQTSDKTFSLDKLIKKQQELSEKIESLSFCLYQTAVSVFGNKRLTELFGSKEQIQDFDKKTVTVLFEMEVPDDFDKDDIAQSIEKLAKTFKDGESCGPKFKEFYTGELKILLEIISRVAMNPAELQQEIKQIVFNILESSKIDTSRASAVAVKLTKMKENHKDMTASDNDDENTRKANQADIEQPIFLSSLINKESTESVKSKDKENDKEHGKDFTASNAEDTEKTYQVDIEQPKIVLFQEDQETKESVKSKGKDKNKEKNLPTVEPSAHLEPVEPFMSKLHYPRLPSYWSISPDELRQTNKTYELVKVPLDFERAVINIVEETWPPQYTGIGRDPHRPDVLDFNTIKVIDVQRIENPKLFVKYSNFQGKLFLKSGVLKKSFKKLEDIPYGEKQHPILTTKNADTVLKVLVSDINEHYLFHGTQAEIIDDIAANGFDLSRHKRSGFGDAIFATESSRKGDRYADEKASCDKNSQKKMILLRMALGEIYVTKENKILRPPCKTCLDDHCSDATHNPDGHGFFDSIVVSGDSEFREFFAFDPTQCYPEYVITYKTE